MLERAQNSHSIFYYGWQSLCSHQFVNESFAGKNNKGTKERILNYRTSQVRTVVEHIFRISSSVFRVLRQTLLLEPEKAGSIVTNVVHLHNLLRLNIKSNNCYNPLRLQRRRWQLSPRLLEIRSSYLNNTFAIRQQPCKPTIATKVIRDEPANYFIEKGHLN